MLNLQLKITHILSILILLISCNIAIAQLPLQNSIADKDDLTSNLPIIIIDTDQQIPDEPKIDGRMRVINHGPDTLNNQNDTIYEYDGDIGIEIRGQSSQMFPKKSYALETRDENGDNLNIPLLGMPEENDWVLYAPYSDKSLLRNYISYHIGRQLRTYATRTEYFELIHNNEYKGLYILLEKIKKDNKRVNIASLNPDDISGEELTGGYIIKVDKKDWDFQYDVDGWLSIPQPPYPNCMNITFQYYYPKPDDMHTNQKYYIRNYISEFVNTLTSSNFSDPNDGYQKYINTTSFVDQMILSEISKEVDKYRFSTYFYKEKSTDGGKLFSGPPWDFNLGYSNVNYWNEGNNYAGWLYELTQPHDDSIMFWWKRLMESSYFRNLFFTRWQYLRSNELSDEAIQNQIQYNVDYIDEAKDRNFNTWPILGEYVWPNYDWQNNDYDDEVAYFSNWLFNRLEWIDNNIEGELLLPNAELSGSYPLFDIDLTDDYFSRPALKPKFFSLQGDTVNLEIDSVIYKNASSISIILSGAQKDFTNISILLKRKILNSYQDLETNSLEIVNNVVRIEETNTRLFYNKNAIHIHSDNIHSMSTNLELVDMSGRLIYSTKFESQNLVRIPVNIHSGIFICTLRNKNQNESFKIFVP